MTEDKARKDSRGEGEGGRRGEEGGGTRRKWSAGPGHITQHGD